MRHGTSPVENIEFQGTALIPKSTHLLTPYIIFKYLIPLSNINFINTKERIDKQFEFTS